jgi:spore maturation protein CgeB
MEFRRKHQLNKKPFADQVKALQRENLMLPGSWADEMTSHGFEVLDVLYPDLGLLSRWARENGYRDLALTPSPFEILKAMVIEFKPDVIFIYAGALYWITRAMRDEIRSLAQHNILIIGFWGDELCEKLYKYGPFFGDLDFVFTSSEHYSKIFDSVGLLNLNIGNAFDSKIDYTSAKKKDIDVLFCGSTGYGMPEHLNRYNTLRKIIPQINIKIYGNDLGTSWWTRRKINVLRLGMILPRVFWRAASAVAASRVCRFIMGRRIRLADMYSNAKITGIGPWICLERSAHPNIGLFDFSKPLRRLFPKVFRKPLINGSDYLSLLTRAKIVLNIHRDEIADVGNIRVYEATGVGACLLTDRGELLRDRFEPGVEVATFEGADELVEKVKYLLSHALERERIAAAGQQRCLADHTVERRCEIIAKQIEMLAVMRGIGSGSARSKQKRLLIAKYDTQGQPISYDIAFFLQAAEIRRRQLNCDRLMVALVPPANIHNQPGVSDKVNQVVDGFARSFRMAHILVQMSDLMRTTDVLHLKSRHMDPFELRVDDTKVHHYPAGGIPHHCEYYKLVNENPALVPGFEASAEAHRYIRKWLDPIARGRRVIVLTLRQYQVNTERNNNLYAWKQFLSELDPEVYAVVIVPDTDAIGEFHSSVLGEYPVFEATCFDVDLRFALYEQAWLNMFVNNGPSVAAGLDKKINYLMFKLVVPNTPTTDPEFIKMLGFELGKSPSYATKTQKWVWEDDSYDVIRREFDTMVSILSYDGRVREISH